MIVDILNTDKKYITQNLVQYISTKLGERHCTIHLALSSCIPIVFSGILIKSSTISSIESMLDLIISKKGIDTDFLDNPELLYTNNERIVKKGQENLRLLFGNKTDKITKEIQKTTGVQLESAKELMKVTMTITMATLSIKANSEGWNSNELLNYLIRYKKNIEESTPAKVKEIIQLEDTEIEKKPSVVTSQKKHRRIYWVKYVIMAIVVTVFIFIIKNGCSNNSDKANPKAINLTTKGLENQVRSL